MLLKIKDFSTIIFDCDGVILDSNQVKTEAFKKTLAKYSEKSLKEISILLKEKCNSKI